MSETNQELAEDIARGALNISWWDTESAARRVAEYAADRIEQLEAALRDIADGMGEKSLMEIGRDAPVIARKALGQDTGKR